MKKLNIDLSNDEWRALCAQAQADSMPVEAYVASLLRDQLAGNETGIERPEEIWSPVDKVTPGLMVELRAILAGKWFRHDDGTFRRFGDGAACEHKPTHFRPIV